MDHWKRLNYTYNKVNFFLIKPLKKPEQYDKWKEENPAKWPGPQQYFKTPLEKFEVTKIKNGEEGEAAADDGDKKEFYSDRRKTDKRIYKPMKGHIF